MVVDAFDYVDEWLTTTTSLTTTRHSNEAKNKRTTTILHAPSISFHVTCNDDDEWLFSISSELFQIKSTIDLTDIYLTVSSIA